MVSGELAHGRLDGSLASGSSKKRRTDSKQTAETGGAARTIEDRRRENRRMSTRRAFGSQSSTWSRLDPVRTHTAEKRQGEIGWSGMHNCDTLVMRKPTRFDQRDRVWQ